MKIDTFELERIQSMYENMVEYNLTESGLHPYTLSELLSENNLESLMDIPIGYGQTNGSLELRNSISNLYHGAKNENILVTNGSAEANFITIWSLLEPGDELVLMFPNYMQIWGLANSMRVNIKPIYLHESLSWSLDMNEVRKQITANTKMIALCNPNNPTGATLSETTMQEIVRLASDVGAWIYCDEIYRGAELEGNETPSFYKMSDKVIVNGGLSKAYGLPGLRIGWLTGPPDIIEKAWSYNDYITISSSILSQAIACQVLQPKKRMEVLNRNRKMLKENIAAVMEWINSHKDIFHLIPPIAGGMAFVKYNMDINSRQLADRLRTEKSVFIMDGDCFGMDHYFRIGFGSKKNYLIAGLNRIDELLRELV